MKICDYSSLIFAGNTTVLLIVSLSTDYWEFRTFDKDEVLRIAKNEEHTDIVMPFDTDSYFQIVVASELNCSGSMTARSFYQAPLFIVQRTCKGFDKADAEDTDGEEIVKYQELNFFQQYGNLFRDCDEIEKLESLSSACAMVCIVCITVGAATGALGLFSRHTNGRTFYIASSATLIAGFSLTLAIALFHGRCQVLKNMALFPGRMFPFKEKLNKLRIYSFGWSFILAWICVFFCYISSYVWLCKTQKSSTRYKYFGQTGQVLEHSSVHRIQSMVFMNYMKYRKVAHNEENIATL